MDGAKGDHVVAPLARPREAASILGSLGWPAAPSTGNWSNVSFAYVTSLAAILLAASAVALIVGLLVEPLVLLWILGALVAIAARWLGWRHTRYSLSDAILFVEHGWWRRRRSILPARNIQSIDIAENFWSRAFGICTLRLGVAGGGGFSLHHIPALPRAESQALRATLFEVSSPQLIS